MNDTAKISQPVVKKTRLQKCIDLYVSVNGKQPSEEQVQRWRTELGWWADIPTG